MNIIDIINKKKNNKELSLEEINYFINGYLDNSLPDYQISSLLMAIVINGMSEEEVFDLTDVMLKSGNIVDLSKIDGIKIDKHSTGGIGDKVSLIVLPLAASAGVKIAKMSGRGLGFTGGTIDKLESIKGFKASMSIDKFIKEVNDISIALISQTSDLVPADKKLYALRDVTGTAESIPLIASSIMSKKIASGSDKILLDIKVGKGAFMKNLEDARKLANLMVKIGKNASKETIAILTNMDYPLGKSIGNGLEVKEAINALDGNCDKDLLELCIHEASLMLSMSKDIPFKEAKKIIEINYHNKIGLNKLKELITYQGGNINKVDICNNIIDIRAKKSGYIYDIDTLKLSSLVSLLGAGRTNINDKIDYGVGM